MSSSKLLLFLSVSFIVGVFCASFWKMPMWLAGELAGLGILYGVAGFAFWKREAILVFGLCLLIFGLAVVRTNQLLEVQPPKVGQSQVAVVTMENAGVLVRWRVKLVSVINENFSEPQASILAGILIGEQKNISYEWKQKMNITGVRHITAVSGANIVLLAEMLVWLGLVIGLYRQKALWLAMILIVVYVIFIGYPASAVRAGIMGILLLLSQVLGRQNATERTIFLAAAVMLAINPALLWADWGFQLSFLATLGIVYLTPYFNNLLNKFAQLLEVQPPKVEQAKAMMAGGIVQGLKQFLAMTLAAQIFTLPMVIYNFGYLSLVALLSNLLIFPIISLIMAFGFVFVIVGAISPFLAMIFSLPNQLLLNYLITVVDWCSRLPFVTLRLSYSPIILFLLYAGLMLWVWRIKVRAKENWFI